MSTYSLTRFDDAQAARSALGPIADDDSLSIVVTAYEQIAVLDEEGAIVSPPVVADGYWLLYADPDGAETLVLPGDVVAISPIFAGMNAPQQPAP